MAQRASSFTAGLSQLLILRLLSEREMYGYELARAAQALTRRHIHLGEGLLYPLLHGLEQQGLLRSRRQIVGGRPRVYYRTTAKGGRRLATLLAGWREACAAVNSALGEKSYA